MSLLIHVADGEQRGLSALSYPSPLPLGIPGTSKVVACGLFARGPWWRFPRALSSL